MDRGQDRARAQTDASVRQARAQIDDDTGECDDATLNVEGALQVSTDEDIGGDPYNHTGRFERLVR